MNTDKSQSIGTLVDNIKELVISKFGDFSIVLSALSQKNITLKNIYMYDNFRFEAIEETVYDCLENDFPKLTASSTPKAIGSIRYTLHLNYLHSFIVSTRKFND